MVVRHALRLAALVGCLAGAMPAAAQNAGRDVRHSAIPDFDAVAAQNRGVAGFYVAGGLGYGTTARRDFAIVDGFACPGAGVPYLGPVSLGTGSGCATSAAMSGFTAHATVGWNFAGTGDGWVPGLELRGRLGREGGGGRLGGTAQVGIPGIPGYTNSARGTYRADLDGGIAVMARYGYSFSGFMPFLRAGFGMARLSERVDFDATGSRACTLTGIPPAASCTTGGTVASHTARWLPSAVLGAGLEVPYGRIFFRLDGEVEAVFSPSQNLVRTLAGQALVTAAGAPAGGVPATAGSATLRSENWIVARRVMLSAGFRF